MPCWTFSRQGSFVLVEAKREILQFILSRVSPYLQVQEFQGEHSSKVWMIQAQLTSTAGTLLKAPERLSYDETSVSVDPLTRIVEVSEASEQLVGQRVVRLLRNIFRLLLAQDSVFVHGGMIQVAGHGIAFLGAKKAGKTSSLLAALTQAQASFIENDSLSFHFLGARPYGLGWFRSTYIRRDVFAALEAILLRKQIDLQHLEQARDKSGLSPEEFATAFRCPLLSHAGLHLLIFPSFLPREEPSAFSLLPMTREEAVAALKKHLVPVPNEYHQFLRPHFSLAAENMDLLEKLVTLVPCYRLRQSFSAIAAAAQAVITLADSNHPSITGNTMSS